VVMVRPETIVMDNDCGDEVIAALSLTVTLKGNATAGRGCAADRGPSRN